MLDDIDALDLTGLEDWPEGIKEKELNEANGHGSDSEPGSSFENITEPEERIYFFSRSSSLQICAELHFQQKRSESIKFFVCNT